MNMINRSMSTALLCLLVAGSGCKEIEVATRVHADGSVERTVTVKSESAEFEEIGYPAIPGTGWASEHEMVQEGGEDRHIHRLHRTFPSAGSLQAEMDAERSDAPGLHPTIAVHRRFRWFVTYYDWVESVPNVSPYLDTPMRSRFSEAQIDSLIAGEASEDLQEEVSAWEIEIILEDLYREITEQVRSGRAPGLEGVPLADRKEALYARLQEDLEDSDPSDMVEPALDVIGKVLERDVHVLAPAVQSWQDRLNQYLAWSERLSGETYAFTVQMPGLLVDTNAREVEGSRASWKVDPYLFRFTDFSMTALSRRTNPWALWVTALFLLLMVGLTAYSVIRGRRAV